MLCGDAHIEMLQQERQSQLFPLKITCQKVSIFPLPSRNTLLVQVLRAVLPVRHLQGVLLATSQAYV